MNKKQKEYKYFANMYMGKTVNISINKLIKNNFFYLPIFSGNITGEDIIVYLLGDSRSEDGGFYEVVGIIKKENDANHELIVSPKGMKLHQAQIGMAMQFKNNESKFEIDCLYQRSSGIIIYCKEDKEIKYLLLFQCKSKTWSFPKGHIEIGESEIQAANRELLEETGLKVTTNNEFKEEITYNIKPYYKKSLVLFLACTKEKTIDMESDMSEYRWVNSTNAKKLLKEEQKKLIDKAQKFILSN